MGQCMTMLYSIINLFRESRCEYCDVPYYYYENSEHRSRPSCRESHNGHHTFR